MTTDPVPDALPAEELATTCVGENIWTMFHRVWTTSTGADKRDWVKLEKKIRDIQAQARKAVKRAP